MAGGRQGFASMSNDRVREVGLKARAKRFNRTEEEESDLEQENQKYQKTNQGGYASKGSHKTFDDDSYGKQGRQGKGKQGFASMDSERAKEIQLQGRAASNHRSVEEESDVEEENEANGTKYDSNASRKRSGNSSGNTKKSYRKDSNEGADDYNYSSRSGKQGNQGKGKQGFASMDPERAKEIQLKGRAASNHRSVEEESDVEEENEANGTKYDSNASRKRNNDNYGSTKKNYRKNEDSGDYDYSRKQGKQGKGKQGFASMDSDRAKEIQLQGRAASAGRSVEEESDFEEEHMNDDDYEREHNNKSRKNYNSTQYSSKQARQQGQQGKGKQGFASMDPERAKEIQLKGRAASHHRSVEEESDVEEDNENNGTKYDSNASRKRNSDNYGSTKKSYRKDSNQDYDDNHSTSRKQGKQSKGKQGFASMDPERAKEIQLRGRAASNHRSVEEESDVEEENEANGTKYDSNASRKRNGDNNGYSKGGNTKKNYRKNEDSDDYDYSRKQGKQGKGKQGFASMDSERAREIQLQGRAASAGRSVEEESDFEEDNQDSEYSRQTSDKRYKKSGNQGKRSTKRSQEESDSGDDNERSYKKSKRE